MKRYRMAVVGLHFGKWLIDNEIIKGYAAPYFELAAVCDQNEVLAHACAREYHVCLLYTSEAGRCDGAAVGGRTF